VDLASGQGNYGGYTEHTVTTGTETMNKVYTNGTVAAHYGFTWTFSNSSGAKTTGGSSGNFTYSSSTFYYEKGTDNLTGYVNPTVWFFMDSSLPRGGTFSLLNTQMTVMDKNFSYSLSSQGRYVQSIHAQGSSSYYRNDVYGKFNAAYTWDTYHDPSTGYIIGYSYVEHDTDNSGNGFTWTENLYVTTTSYALATASAPPPSSQLLFLIIGLLVIFVPIIIVIVVVVVLLRRRSRMPKHSVQDYSRMPSPMGTPPPTIDLTPKQQPAQQIVIKEVAKVRCKYCGALVDSTAVVCPICGGPTT
jgi:zinc-ribbon domain